MTKLSQILSLVIVLLIGAITFSTLRTCSAEDKVKEQLSMINSLNDTVKIWKDKDGLSNTSNSVITTQNPDDFTNLKNLSEENKKLQADVKKYKDKIKNGGNVTNFGSNTEASSTTITKVDTVTIDNTKQLVYSSSFDKEGWVTGDIVARTDSTTVNVKVKNEYTVVIGYDKTGFLGLGKPIPFSQVTSLNPYSSTPTLKTYQVDIKRKRTWVVPTVIALGVGVVTGVLISK